MTSGRITAIQAQKRDHNRVNIFIDGRFRFSLTRLVAAWLEVGQELSEEKITSLVEQDSHESAYQITLRFLDSRPRTSVEIHQRLKKAEYPEEVIQDILNRLNQAGLVDDKNYSAMWIENRSDFRPRSQRALAQELRRKGVDQETIAEALEGIDDTELAYQAALKQAPRYASLDWDAFKHKMYGFLGRRGFNFEVTATTTRRVWSEFHETSPAGADIGSA